MFLHVFSLVTRFSPVARSLGGLIGAAGLLGPAPTAHAAGYPVKPVSIIVPYSAGGTTDIVARQIAEALRQELGKPFIVDNRPGAGATLGAMTAAHSRPDGYTLLLGQVSSHSIAPAVYKNLPYRPLEDFQPITLLMSIPNVMVVKKDHPAKDVADFLRLARGHKVRFGSSGIGSSVHLTGEMFKGCTGLEMTHVPFRGSSDAIPALMSGDIDVIFDNLPASMPHVRSGALRALAVTTKERSQALPEVPALAELGIPELAGFEARSWFGLLAPKKVSPAIIVALSSAANRALLHPEFEAYAAQNGGIIAANTPAEFHRFIEAELIRWKAVVDQAGVTVEAGVKASAAGTPWPLSPFFLPSLVAALIVMFALLHALKAWTLRSRGQVAKEVVISSHAHWRSRLLAIGLGLGAYLLLPQYVGMLGVSILVTAGLMLIGGERSPLTLGGVAVAFPVIAYLFFLHIAHVPFPLGLFE